MGWQEGGVCGEGGVGRAEGVGPHHHRITASFPTRNYQPCGSLFVLNLLNWWWTYSLGKNFIGGGKKKK